MNNIPGFALQNVVLIVASYFLLLLVNKRTRSNSGLLLVAILTFHHVVAYLYAFHLSFPENEVDPATFLLKAEKCIYLDECGYLGYHLYVNYLAKALEFGGSLYFVFLLNVLFFVISIYLFLGIADQLDLKGNRKAYLILYGMWPSVVYFTTLHYREPFELYFLMAGIYFGLTASKKDSFLLLLTSMTFLFAMGLFHIKGLLLLSIIIFLMIAIYRMPLNVAAIAKRVVLLAIMGTGIYFSYTMYTKNIIPVKNLVQKESVVVIVTEKLNELFTDEEVVQPAGLEKNKITAKAHKSKSKVEISFVDSMIRKILVYRSILLNEREVRTAFLSKMDDKNTATFILTFSIVYFEYLFSPFIFQVSSFHEMVAYAESLVRTVLFISALFMIKNFPQTRILFLIYLAVTAMWTIGVVSFGAGIRHHIQTNWMLVLLGVPAISEYLRMSELNLVSSLAFQIKEQVNK